MSIFINYCLASQVIRKNFRTICRCLPLNYKDKVLESLGVEAPNSFLKDMDPEKFNERTIMLLMMTTIRSNEDVLHFFDVLEQKVDDKASTGVIEILKHGNSNY